jgi:hypothetical protein
MKIICSVLGISHVGAEKELGDLETTDRRDKTWSYAGLDEKASASLRKPR